MLVTLANVHLLVSMDCRDSQDKKQLLIFVTFPRVILSGSVSVLRFGATFRKEFILVAASKSQPLRSRLGISLF